MNHSVREGLFSLVLLSALAAPAWAAPPEEAYAAFLRGDYAKAQLLLEPLAEQGVPQAQYYLALMFDMGHGVPKNFEKALKWYRSAAGAGLAPAQFSLAQLYETGDGVEQDQIEALKWLELAAMHGTGGQRLEAAKQRDRLAARLTAAQIAEAKRRSGEWSPAAPMQYRHPPKAQKMPAAMK